MITKVQNSQQLHDCQLELHYANSQMTYFFPTRSQLPGMLFGLHNVNINYNLLSHSSVASFWFISQVTQNNFFGGIYEFRSLLKNRMVLYKAVLGIQYNQACSYLNMFIVYSYVDLVTC